MTDPARQADPARHAEPAPPADPARHAEPAPPADPARQADPARPAPPADTAPQAALARAHGLRTLRDAALGDRLVVRAHHGDGARDALGLLAARTPHTVTIDTRRGPVEIALDTVVAAKPVPPPPARRRPASRDGLPGTAP